MLCVCKSKCITVQLVGFFFFFGLFVFLPFLRPLLWHMEFPRPGVKLEIQLLAYATATNTRSEPHLPPIPQLMAMPDP